MIEVQAPLKKRRKNDGRPDPKSLQPTNADADADVATPRPKRGKKKHTLKGVQTPARQSVAANCQALFKVYVATRDAFSDDPENTHADKARDKIWETLGEDEKRQFPKSKIPLSLVRLPCSRCRDR